MKNVSINAQQIGSSVVAESANVSTNSVSNSSSNTSEQIGQMIAKVSENLCALDASQDAISKSDLQELSRELREALSALDNSESDDKKRDVVDYAIAKIRGTLGVAGDTMKLFLELSKILS